MQYRGQTKSSTSATRSRTIGDLHASLVDPSSNYQQIPSDQFRINPNPGSLDADMSFEWFAEDDMDISTLNDIPGHTATPPTVSMPDAEPYGMSATLDYATYVMEEEPSSSEMFNGDITSAPTGYMMPPAGQVYTTDPLATNQTATVSSGSSTTSENALTPALTPTSMLPFQFGKSTPESDDLTQYWEMTPVKNPDNISPSPLRRPSRLGTLRTRRRSAQASAGNSISSPSRDVTPLTPLAADLELFKQLLDAELGEDFWMTQLGRMPLSGLSPTLQPMSSGSVSDNTVAPQKPPEISLSIVEDAFTAGSEQLHTLPTRSSDMQTDPGVAQMPTFPALTSVSSGFPQAYAENEAPLTFDSDELFWYSGDVTYVKGGPTQHLQYLSPTENLWESTEFSSCSSSPAATQLTWNESPTIEAVKVFPSPSMTLTVAQTSEMQRPSSRTTPSKPEKPLPRQVAVLRHSKWEKMPIPPTSPSKDNAGSISRTASVEPDLSASPLEENYKSPSSRTVPSEPGKLPKNRRIASAPRRIPAPRKEERETTTSPWNPSLELTDCAESTSVKTAVESVSSANALENVTLTPTPSSLADSLSPLDGLNPLPRPFSLPNFVKRLSLPLSSGKLRSVLDLTANWEMHGLTIPWYVERTEQLTSEVIKGIERCFYVTAELIQRFEHSLLKVDLLIAQCGAMCDVLRSLYRVAGQTHKCRGGCKGWHRTHNKMLKKLQDRIDMCFVLVTTPISPNKRAKKMFHFLQKLDEWVKTLRV